MEKPVDTDLEFLLDLARHFFEYGECARTFHYGKDLTPSTEDIKRWLENRSK